MVSWIETKTAPDHGRRRAAGVKTTRRKGHVVCGDGPDGGGGEGGGGGVVKGEINELRNKRKER